MKKIFFITILLFNIIYSREQEVEHVLEGNLSLPTSQQPSPLFCFGQNIVDKGDTQFFGFTDILGGKNNKFYSEIIPYCIYGITDNLALYTGIPFATKFKDNNFCSSGIEDIFVQFEYAFHNKDKPTYANQATVVIDMTLPTGSPKKNPDTGLGSPSFFIGLTANHMSIDWYVFASPGILLTTGKSRKELGNRLLYQFGFGRNLNYVPAKRIISLIIEFFGVHNTQNSDLHNIISRHLTSSSFYIGPSLWISTQKFILSTGIAFPVAQNTDSSNKNNYFFAAEIGYKFN